MTVRNTRWQLQPSTRRYGSRQGEALASSRRTEPQNGSRLIKPSIQKSGFCNSHGYVGFGLLIEIKSILTVSPSVSRSIRRQALQKIASLSATSSTTTFDNSDLDRLCRGCPRYGQNNPQSNGLAKAGSQSLAGSPMVCTDSFDYKRDAD